MTGWLPDSAWIRALNEIKGSIAFAIFAASTAVCVLAAYKKFHLDSLPPLVLAIIAIIAILSFCLFCARLWDWASHKIVVKQEAAKEEREQQEAETARQAREREILGFLDTLSAAERKRLAYLVHNNQQSFNCAFYDGPVATMVQKGLVVRGGGAQSAMDLAHTIPNFVWAELQRRKNEFVAPD